MIATLKHALLRMRMKIMPPRFPVFWITVLAFTIVAAATLDVLFGGFLFIIVLPGVLIGQWCVRWVFGRFGSPLWLRRSVMLLPTLILAVGLFRSTNDFGGRQKAAVTIALAGKRPSGIKDLHVYIDSWTDYVVFAYFRCDPISLREILEHPPFVRAQYQQDRFSFSQIRFPDLRALPDKQGIITFERTDLEKANGSCTVYTDAAFSFVYVTYGVD